MYWLLSHIRVEKVYFLMAFFSFSLHTVASSDDESFVASAFEANIEWIQFLIEQGYNVNCTNYKKITALMIASMRGRTDVVKLLLLKGADINSIDCDGETAFVKALLFNDHLTELLVSRGSVISKKVKRQDKERLLVIEQKRDHEIYDFLEVRSDMSRDTADLVVTFLKQDISFYKKNRSDLCRKAKIEKQIRAMAPAIETMHIDEEHPPLLKKEEPLNSYASLFRCHRGLSARIKNVFL